MRIREKDCNFETYATRIAITRAAGEIRFGLGELVDASAELGALGEEEDCASASL